MIMTKATTPSQELEQHLAESKAESYQTAEFASFMDSKPESVTHMREKFHFPTTASILAEKADSSEAPGFTASNDVVDKPAVYLCGNSLGLMPKSTGVMIGEELNVWARKAVVGHFKHDYGRPWKKQADKVLPELMAPVVGASTDEVAIMGSLTANIHHLLASFYRPTEKRHKILFELKAFPSDQYAFASQVERAGYSREEGLIEVGPRKGEYTLRTEDILDVIEKQGEEVAVMMFSGVQYFSGQRFDIETITAAAKAKGCVVGWDLAHAAGNTPLRLHDWGVDFAAWCTYKYLNSGPGGVGGIFVHSNHHGADQQRLAGWWGHNADTRFAMPPVFEPSPGAGGFQVSTPPALDVIALLSSLQTLQSVSSSGSTADGISILQTKSRLLTTYLYTLLVKSKYYVPPEASFGSVDKVSFTIITPSTPEDRGAQLSLLLLPSGKGIMPRVYERLEHSGVVGDEREPDVIRLTPVPMYNSYSDCFLAVQALHEALEAESA